MATDSIAQTAFNAIVTALQGVDGTGDYDHDVSDHVYQDGFAWPPTSGPRGVYVARSDLIIARTGPQVPLGYYYYTLSVDIVAWTYAAMGSSAKADDAYTLLDDLAVAVTSSRSLGGIAGVLDVTVSDARAYPETAELGTAGYGVVEMTVQVIYQRRQGV